MLSLFNQTHKPNEGIVGVKKERAVKIITQARRERGMSMWQASEKAGINQSTWSRVETGVRDATWDTLLQMAKAVGLKYNVTINN